MKIYIIGIGGAGTSALATIYHKKGYEVMGVDEGDDGFYSDELRRNQITVHDHFNINHINGDIDLIVHSTSIQKNNCEMIEAIGQNIKIMSYPEAIGVLSHEMKTVAVCGTHGKTTTTALTAYAMISADIKPTVIVGSRIAAWGSGAYYAGDHYFIVEADEYQNKLALYYPFAVILTSIDFDHPDFFADFAIYKKTFSDFIKRIPQEGVLVACGDGIDVREVAHVAQCRVIFYGENDNNDCVIKSRSITDEGQEIVIAYHDNSYVINTQLYGAHNAKNAVAAWVMSSSLTLQESKAAEGICEFVGTARRFEKRGYLNGAILIDDYAHHPEEIRATLNTAREIYPHKKIIVAFHPHTFSRTKALLNGFAETLNIADHVIVLDIYSSARESGGSVSAYDLVDAINAYAKHDKAEYHATVDELAVWMKDSLDDNDVLLTLGAGDIWKVYSIIEDQKSAK